MPTAGRPPSPALFLIDGYALIYRAFFALLSRPLRTAKGENTSAAWGVVGFLQRLVEKHKPEYVAWIHDAGSSFRTEVYADYKATREKLSSELQQDFDQGLERIESLLSAFGVPIITVSGFEADDVIGTMARQALEKGVNAVVVSGDKDFQQLVRPGIWLLNPGRGGPASVDEQWVGMENATDRLGVDPRFVTDFLALIGDSSDNVPGVPGIGDKTAQELIATWGDLDSIMAHAGEVSRKRPREALQQYREQAYLSRQLVTIRQDVPFELELQSLRAREADRARLRKLFVELEFTTLLPTLEDRSVPAGPRPVGDYRLVETTDEVEAATASLKGARLIALSIASTGVSGESPLRNHIAGIALGAEDGPRFYIPLHHQPWAAEQGDLLGGAGKLGGGPEGESLAANAIRRGEAAPANLPGFGHPSFAGLRQLLEDPAVAKITRQSKADSLMLRGVGVTLRGVEFDVTLASYVLDPNRRSHEVPLLAFEMLDRTVESRETVLGKGRVELGFENVPATLARDTMCEEVELIHALREAMLPRLESAGGLSLLTDVELPLVSALAEMEWTGVAIDADWFASLKSRFHLERSRIEKAIWAVAGEEFNINSNPKLRGILFDKLKLPVRKRTASGPSTDASVLQELAEEGHELPLLLMEYREIAKLESTYLDTLPGLVLPRDQRIHTTYNQTVAATGRLSSQDPNLQNIPIRRELGKDIRRGFIPRPGWQFVAADYSQIELRLLAHLSGDDAFVAAFRAGGDIHRQTAAIIFGVAADDVTAEMRARAKTINFATIYGQGPNALSRQLRISVQEARDFIATYFERFSGVRQYLDSMVAFAKSNGYVETIFRRRRYIPELKERNFNIRAFGERVAANAPIQGSAADLIKVAMIRLHDAIVSSKLASRMILQVHDELVFEAPASEVSELPTLIREHMEGAASLAVPLVVDIGSGDNWLDAKS
ncbi:MAG: DNA polymerase I [Gemmatimonadota bacterium]